MDGGQEDLRDSRLIKPSAWVVLTLMASSNLVGWLLDRGSAGLAPRRISLSTTGPAKNMRLLFFLLQPILNFPQSGPRAVVVQLGSRRAACADGSDGLIAKLDYDAAAKEHDVREFGER